MVESDQGVARQDGPVGPVRAPGLVASREHAVNLVFKGSGLALLGVTIGLGADFFNVGMWGVLLIGGGLAAGGLSMIGRAARHLWQYGGRLEASLLTAFGGLGASVLLATVGQTLLRLDVLAPLGRVLTGLGVVGTLLAAASAVALVLWALERWMSTGLVDDA